MNGLIRITLPVIATLLLAACASTPVCQRSQVHDNARLIDSLAAPAELQVPAPDPSLEISPASLAEGQPHPRTRPDGSCVHEPPRYIPPEQG